MNGVHERRATYTGNFRADAVERVLRKGATADDVQEVANELKIPPSTLLLWIDFARQGLAADDAADLPLDQPTNEGEEMAKKAGKRTRINHSEDTKKQALALIRSGMTLRAAAAKLGIPSPSVISRWVIIDEAESRRPGQAKPTKSAKLEPKPAAKPAGLGQTRGGGRDPSERLRAAEKVLDQGREIRDVAAEHKVTESTVYSWTLALRRERGLLPDTKAKPEPQPARQAVLEQVFERPTRPVEPARASKQTALALPTVNGHPRAQVLPQRESANTAELRARCAQLEAQNRKLRALLKAQQNIMLDEETIEVGP